MKEANITPSLFMEYVIKRINVIITNVGQRDILKVLATGQCCHSE